MATTRVERARRRCAGFTLLEVLFATAVLSITLMATVSSQLAALNLMRTARDSSTAIAELSTALEEVLSRPIDSIPVAAGFPEGTAIASYNDRALRDERITPDYPNYAGGAIPDVLEIVLQLDYTDWAGRAATMRLASRKAR